jgi:hypothetical protein
MYASCIYILYLCMFHRWMALRRERVALAHMPRIRASSAPARDRTRMHEHSCVPIYITGLGVDRYIYSYMTWALAIYTGGRTHACARDGDGRIVGARNRTHVCIAAVEPHARPYPSLAQVQKHLYIYIHVECIHVYTIYI